MNKEQLIKEANEILLGGYDYELYQWAYKVLAKYQD